MFLIVSCSDQKNKTLKVGKARDIYVGPLTTLGVKYAEKSALKPYILSGKYGIIEPDTVIETYNERHEAYDGVWPEGEGYWIGGWKYFQNAPLRIKRFFPIGTSYCKMKSWLNQRVYPERYGYIDNGLLHLPGDGCVQKK